MTNPNPYKKLENQIKQLNGRFWFLFYVSLMCGALIGFGLYWTGQVDDREYRHQIGNIEWITEHTRLDLKQSDMQQCFDNYLLCRADEHKTVKVCDKIRTRCNRTVNEENK